MELRFWRFEPKEDVAGGTFRQARRAGTSTSLPE